MKRNVVNIVINYGIDSTVALKFIFNKLKSWVNLNDSGWSPQGMDSSTTVNHDNL